MTTEHSIETFQADVLVERRVLDLATNTFTRENPPGVVVETRPLTAGETAQLNEKAAQGARNAAFAQARVDAVLVAPPFRDIFATILDELERIRGS